MSSIKVSLFGKFNIAYGDQRTYIRARKVQELLIYLLVFRNQPQPRESLSEILWADQSIITSKRNLRQTLWHLQSAFKGFKNSSGLELLIDDGWIHIRLPSDFWLDTAEFEQVFNRVNPKNVQELNIEDFNAMQYAVSLYRGDLLEGWYQDWCIFERERFQMMNLMLLDKLVQYCEIHRRYDVGITYAWQILRHDHAYERAHRLLMRLYALSGDRTQALHQYQRCANALHHELGVEPSLKTRQLFDQIQADTFAAFSGREKAALEGQEDLPTIETVLRRLEQLSSALKRMESEIQEEISVLEKMLPGRARRSPDRLPKLPGN